MSEFGIPSRDDEAAREMSPEYDLAAWITRQQDSGDNEVDPYSYAVTLIKVALEFALDDGISGSMSQGERDILVRMAEMLVKLDPHIEIDPRVG